MAREKELLEAEKKHWRDLQRIKNFRLMDDDFMTKVFEDNIECTELLLRIILDKQDLHVRSVKTQYSIKNLQGRSIRLDIFADDSEDKKYNIEIQRDDRGAGAKRARYNNSIIDANSLFEGMQTEDLPESYVIFIMENDVFGDDEPIYHIDRIVRETDKVFFDGSHIIYVNGSYRDESPLGLLMHDFMCRNPNEMYYKELADRVRYFKEDEKGRDSMCRSMEELVIETTMREKRNLAIRLLQRGKMTKEEIAEDTELSMDEINALEQENQTELA